VTTEITLALRGKRGKERRLGETRRTPGGGARRLPDLSALPSLLGATGSFAGLRDRLGSAAGDGDRGVPARTGRHVGLTAVPHGAKTYLAAALALVADGERLVWIARDAEIGDRVAEELGAWLGDPGQIAVLEPRTALAYERSELVADETAARVAALSAWRSGQTRILVASVQALLQHTIALEDLPAEPVASASAAGCGRTRSSASFSGSATRRPRRWPAAASSRDAAGSSTSSPVRAAPGPPRAVRRRDRLAPGVRPTDQRTVGTLDEAILLPASEFLAPAGGAAALRERLGRVAARLPETSRRGSRPVRGRRRGGQASGDGSAPGPGPTRAVAVGDAAEVWAAQLAPATGFDHIDPGTLLVLDEPGEIAEAAAFLWRQADERRAELIASADLPKDWPSTYLGRATGSAASSPDGPSSSPGNRRCPRRPPSPRAASARGTCSAGGSPRCRPRVPRRSSTRSSAGRRTAPGSCSPPTRRHASPSSSTRLVMRRRSCTPSSLRHPARSPSWSAASTAGSRAARTALPSSPTGSCSGPFGFAGRRRCGASSRATSWSASSRAISSSISTTASPGTSGCSAAATGPRARIATTSS